MAANGFWSLGCSNSHTFYQWLGSQLFRASDFGVLFFRVAVSGVPVPVLDYALRFLKVPFDHLPSWIKALYVTVITSRVTALTLKR